MRTLLLLALALLACRPAAQSLPEAVPAALPSPPIGLLQSQPTFEALGWRGRWEWQGARAFLDRLSVDHEVVRVEELDTWNGRLLVLPNVRNMAPETVARIVELTRGGTRLLATGMTSYRQADNSSWSPNNFALAPIFGADFHRWVGAPPDADTLVFPDGARVPLGRNTAMLVRPREGTAVLAVWDKPDLPAIVEGPGGIYAGEDLFSPENSRSPEVARVLLDLVRRTFPEAKLEGEPAFPSPEPPFLPIAAESTELRVGLGRTERNLVLRAPEGVYRGRERQDELKLEGGLSEPIVVRGDPYLEVLQVRPNGTCRWSAYRGSLEVTPVEGGFELVNVLPFEDYLAGVVPSEVPAYFPPECLSAMAIVARTFATSHLDRHADFDVCAEVHCQVYRGLAQEAASTTSAVADTAGTLLTYHGRPADTTFHAACGGVGEDAFRAWARGQAVEYLQAQVDLVKVLASDLQKEENLRSFIDDPPAAYCEASGRFRWEESYPWPELAKRLEEGLGAPLGTLEQVAVSRRTPLGRVAELTIVGSQATHRVEGDAVRWLFSGGKVGPGGLNSTLFYLEREGDRLIIKGGGWGHGVGLCQEGAAGRARAGHDHARILDHYYPGTELTEAASRP